MLNSNNIYNNGGSVGIGSTSPSSKLEVFFNDFYTVRLRDTRVGSFGSGATILFEDRYTGSTTQATIGVVGNGGGFTWRNGALEIRPVSRTNFYKGSSVTSATDVAMTILGSGNVGVGTDAPGATLHVNGTVRITTGNQALNKVLTSDAAGNADWQTLNTPILGVVNSNATVGAGSGFTVTSSSVGIYTVAFTTPLAAAPAVVVTPALTPVVALAAGSYCAATYGVAGCTDNDDLTNVSTTGGLTNISNLGTGCAGGTTGYSDYSGVAPVTQLAGASFTLNCTSNPLWSKSYGVWVDWNSNGTFEASEFVASTGSTGFVPVSLTVTVPGGQAAGTYRMRIRTAFACVVTSAMGCAATCSGFGETEDYNLVVVNPGGAAVISAVDNVTTTGFSVYFTNTSGTLTNSKFHFNATKP